MKEEIDCYATDEITCPHCGNEFTDSWECEDEGNHTCDECGKEFSHNRDICVTYSTFKKDPNNEA